MFVGAGGSPFDPSAAQATAGVLTNPATDRDYAWATVKVHADGGVDILGYGFDANFGPTQLIGQYFIAAARGSIGESRADRERVLAADALWQLEPIARTAPTGSRTSWS